MAKRQELVVALISSGELDSELHYGSFSRNWWFTSSIKKDNNLEMMYPIRIGMKTQVELNGKNFIMQILKGNNISKNQPGYTSQCDSDSSEIEDNPTNAITSIYRQVFETKTKISSSMVMGFDKESIIAELLYDIEFHPYIISIENKLSVMVFGSGISKNEGWMNFKSDSPENVWRKVGILEKFRGTQLFGLEHAYTQSILQRLFISECQLSQWVDEVIINKWESCGNIIEINITLTHLYPKIYKFTDREIQAWSLMLKAAGCTNITPFNNSISMKLFKECLAINKKGPNGI
ncbi:8156_t:CDS:2 [Diversispora eburnea]|uniref:8156_t:CDS:1 n=1 Tax=Diversispora eburnea TaxID=1213867 RepID=A0A9N8VIA1_9GLOM|nr:8156_t:CDS:2 [Diversispora eburnea]